MTRSRPHQPSFLSATVERGGQNSFDLLRLGAAFAVLVSHSFVLAYGSEAAEPIYRFTEGRYSLGFLAVAAFFVLSGFLISASADRSSSIRSFVDKRARRILPALWVSTVATILVLGLFATTRPVLEYLQNIQTWRYLANAVFLPHDYTLPGVFDANPFPRSVNGSLWSLKYEVACYALVLLAAQGTRRFRLCFFTVAFVASSVLQLVVDPASLRGITYHVALLSKVLPFFAVGAIAYDIRDRLPVSRTGLIVAAAVAPLALTAAHAHALVAASLAYLLLGLGSLDTISARRLRAFGDISYGVYLYSFPVQQLVVMLALPGSRTWWGNVLFAAPIVILLATASWYLVERPMLRSSRSAARDTTQGRVSVPTVEPGR